MIQNLKSQKYIYKQYEITHKRANNINICFIYNFIISHSICFSYE